MIKVLLVEDSPADAARIMALLCEVDREDFAVTYEVSVTDAVERLRTETFDAALLDFELAGGPDAPGMTRLKDHAPLLPLVLLCTRAHRSVAADATKRGAQDYIDDSDWTGELFARSILYAIERVHTAEQLEFLARHDALTGLPNRAAFRDRLAQALARAGRDHKPGALLLVDLDSFKAINDTQGHDVGDALLKHVGTQLRRFVRPYDLVARLGGDEFAILLEDVAEARDAGRMAERIIEEISAPFVIGDTEVFTTASLGAVVFPFDGSDPPTLLRNADFAMYRAKRQGGGTATFYTRSMGARIHEQLALEHDLHRALAHEEFLLHYQPQVDVGSGRIVGMEALARWRHPERGLLPPHTFIPAAEKSGLIGAIGEWALRAACRQRRQWADAGLAVGRMAVNLSPRQLTGNGFVAVTEKTLAEFDLDPSFLDLEITEALLLGNDQATIERLARLRRIGVRISIDDFGTGHSCLSRLTILPVDALKIDRSLIGSVEAHPNNAVARAIIALARELDLGVICEGVEHAGHLAFLHRHGCEIVQGRLICPPLPADEVERWVTSRGATPTLPERSSAERRDLLH